VRSYGAAPIRSLASRSTSAWARAWRLARRKSTSPAIPALRSTSKSATLSIATVFGSSSALDGYLNARNHAVALLSRCHRIYTTFRDLDSPGDEGQQQVLHFVTNFVAVGMQVQAFDQPTVNPVEDIIDGNGLAL